MKFESRPIRLIYLFFALILMAEGQAQECDGFLEKRETGNEIHTRVNKRVSKRELRKNEKEIKAELLEELKVLMAEKILTEVKTKSMSSVVESGQVYEDFYNYETEITTTASIAYGKEDFCTDPKEKVIYGIYVLDRQLTAQAVVLDCKNRMSKLLAETRQANEVNRTKNFDVYASRAQKINRDARVASFLDTNSDQTELIQLYELFQAELQLMETRAGFNDYSEEMGEAQRLIQQKAYSKAIVKLRMLDVEYPNREEIHTLLSDAETRFYASTLNEVELLKAQGKYREALLILDELCSMLTCQDETLSLETELTDSYFDQTYTNFQKAVKFNLERDADIQYQTLTRMASANPKMFEKATRQYAEFNIKQRMRNVEKDLEYKNFHSAFAEVKRIQYEYDIAYSPLISLRKQTETLLLKYEVKKEKRTRKKLFALAVGLEVMTNPEIDIEDVPDPQSYSLAYSFGLYKKFNYAKRYGGDYPKSSDIIGLKLRLVDFYNSYSFPSSTEDRATSSYRYNVEFMVDGSIVRFLHYNVGVSFPDRDLEREPTYFGEFGFRVPAGPVSLQTSLRYNTFDNESIYMLQAGLFCQFDFWRKFNAADRRRIKKEYGL